MQSAFGATCFHCQVRPDQLDALYVGSDFALHSVLQKAIHAMKYHGQHSLAPMLVRSSPLDMLLVGQLQESATILVPVPLAKDRQRERGYNQAEELARAYGQRYGLQVQNLLVRHRPTLPQAKLGRQERMENVRDAFSCIGPSPPSVMLVDDVATTLSTLHACAEALRAKGAQSVRGLVLARARRHG